MAANCLGLFLVSNISMKVHVLNTQRELFLKHFKLGSFNQSDVRSPTNDKIVILNNLNGGYTFSVVQNEIRFSIQTFPELCLK